MHGRDAQGRDRGTRTPQTLSNSDLMTIRSTSTGEAKAAAASELERRGIGGSQSSAPLPLPGSRPASEKIVHEDEKRVEGSYPVRDLTPGYSMEPTTWGPPDEPLTPQAWAPGQYYSRPTPPAPPTPAPAAPARRFSLRRSSSPSAAPTASPPAASARPSRRFSLRRSSSQPPTSVPPVDYRSEQGSSPRSNFRNEEGGQEFHYASDMPAVVDAAAGHPTSPSSTQAPSEAPIPGSVIEAIPELQAYTSAPSATADTDSSASPEASYSEETILSRTLPSSSPKASATPAATAKTAGGGIFGTGTSVPVGTKQSGRSSTSDTPQTIIMDSGKKRSTLEVIRAQQEEENQREMMYHYRQQREKEKQKERGETNSWSPKSGTNTGGFSIDHSDQSPNDSAPSTDSPPPADN